MTQWGASWACSAVAIGCTVVFGGAAGACTLTPSDGTAVHQGGIHVAWRSEPGVIRPGQPFVLQLRVCPSDATLLRVDATMPEHRHGMNYRPSLQSLGDGRWHAQGLLWHMSGRWELRWDVQAAGRTEVLRSSVVLP